MTAKHDLKAFRIVGLPPEFYYIPNFITPEEEASILNKVYTCALHSAAIFTSTMSFRSEHLINKRADTSAAMDATYTSPPPSAPINSHQKQHLTRISPARLSIQPSAPALQSPRRLRRHAPPPTQPRPNQRVPRRRGHNAARRRQRLRPRRRNCVSRLQSGAGHPAKTR